MGISGERGHERCGQFGRDNWGERRGDGKRERVLERIWKSGNEVMKILRIGKY